jgi:hypothetical protein
MEITSIRLRNEVRVCGIAVVTRMRPACRPPMSAVLAAYEGERTQHRSSKSLKFTLLLFRDLRCYVIY